MSHLFVKSINPKIKISPNIFLHISLADITNIEGLSDESSILIG